MVVLSDTGHEPVPVKGLRVATSDVPTKLYRVKHRALRALLSGACTGDVKVLLPLMRPSLCREKTRSKKSLETGDPDSGDNDSVKAPWNVTKFPI